MAITNRQRVEQALELLRQGLAPYLERELNEAIRQLQVDHDILRRLAEDPRLANRPIQEWDVAALLRLMWDTWNDVFRNTLGFAERSLVSELREWRNRWAHQEAFSTDDTYRVLDSTQRLLESISAPQAEVVNRMKQELLRLRYDEQVRQEKRRVGGSLIEAAAEGRLPSWRDVITPHPDVASGRYQQAEFAADLWQVYRGEASDEYQNPIEFFRRTYLTEGLRRLLLDAVARLSGSGGEPVVQLQTNFGGGKTHSMLALYHLFSGMSPAELPSIEDLLAGSGDATLPTGVRRVVLVGTKISPGSPSIKEDGTRVHTLWGELAWQLGGREAYELVREDDERATNPGSKLAELLRHYSPCLILIDEWVAYARQLHDEADLPGGSFETQFTFAQNLTESARQVPRCLLVISLPASDQASIEDIEVGGVRGREALQRLRNVIGRVETSWRPASPEESFEIVRRRLFEPLRGEASFKARDTVARAFAELYRVHHQEFPSECRERSYEERIKAAYPIHPEVFDRLYNDWSTLVRFQRTRGVLRLMATVVHSLWERGDSNPLILPATLPLDDPRVQFELTRYLNENWTPILESDIDGPRALPLQIDREIPALGRYQACRRVARTIFLGSAPLTGSHRGLEDRRIKLGCVMPGESPSVFGDALRRLAARSTYLYHDGTRYWYDTQPTVTRLAEDRAEQLRRNPDRVLQELEQLLQRECRQRGPFAGVHVMPRSHGDVPDERSVRLVVLDPEHPHIRNDERSPALRRAAEFLQNRGSVPRRYRNTLVFLAADNARYQDLEEAIRHYLAWKSILDDQESLNLSPFQVRQAQQRLDESRRTVSLRLPEAYCWLLVPHQPDPLGGEVTWEAIRLTGQNGLVDRVARRLQSEEQLVTSLGGSRLRMELDRIPLWRGNHVEIRELLDDFSSYLYLPRLASPSVLIEAIRDGIGSISWELDGFAYAEGYDEEAGRYRNLKAGERLSITEDNPGLLVKPEVAARQIEQERAPRPGSVEYTPPDSSASGVAEITGQGLEVAPPPPKPPELPHRFFASVPLDPIQPSLQVAKFAEEVLAHLNSLPGVQVHLRLEVQIEAPEGVPERVKQIVKENCRTLGIDNFGFDQE